MTTARRPLGRPGLCLLLLASLACSTLEAQPIPAEYRKPGLRYFVENPGNDRRNLDRFIALALRRRGLDAQPAPVRTRSDAFDVLVVYEDHWIPSMGYYLSSLRIDLRDAKTNALLATGSASIKSSFARTEPKKVIDAIVSELLR